jgi:hypothetical protein
MKRFLIELTQATAAALILLPLALAYFDILTF